MKAKAKSRTGQDWMEGQKDLTPRNEKPANTPPRTEESLVEDMCAHIAVGVPPPTAAILVGLYQGCSGEWIRNAHRDRANGEENSHFIRWASKIQMALAVFETEVWNETRQGIRRDPKMGLEILRRRFPEHWAEPTSQVDIRVGKMQDEEIENRIAELTMSLATKGLLKKGEPDE